ncbi:uncharacterized protein LOC110062437 [Orbicella faveolata]|uniref:uncharacterized protein LOC110062437 n=1 Tax=Orbicella faveolata TaxID=48498 RepID=UPI0009E5C9FF|nr:uncharacterized protein LOC110062437 [Orbicella faveolata]
MLNHWKHGKGSSAATYKALCDALSHELVQRQDLAEKFCYINEPFAIHLPTGAVPAGRVTGEVSGAAASTLDSGDSTGARSTLKRKHSDPDPERENLKDTLEQMRNQVKKLESLLDEDKLQQMKSEIANMSEKLDTLVAQRETDDEDNTRDDFKEMARDIRTISEKLKSQVTSGEEGNSRDNLEQMKTKIADIKETLDTLMNPLPLEEKKQKMEESLKETLEQMGDQLKNVSETLDSLRQASQDEENLKETHKQMRNHEKNISGKLDSLREPSQDEGQYVDLRYFKAQRFLL